MSTLNVGDRVHLKWDHSVTGTFTKDYVESQDIIRVSTAGAREYDMRGQVYTPPWWWERIPDRAVGGREKFQRGDKVRVKHDPIFTGEVCEDFGNMVEIEAAKTTMRLPAKWLERTPPPLKEHVPIEVLREVLSETDGLRLSNTWCVVETRLRERGYGRNDG
jgi:hypothetical protein